MPLKIHIRQVGRVAIIDLEGPLRLGAAEEAFREQARQLLAAGTLFIAVNLARISDVDSSGIGLFVRTMTQCKRAGGTCVFFAANERVLPVLKMVRLEKILDLAEDEASALARLCAVT